MFIHIVIMFCTGQGSSVFIVIVFCAGQGSSVFIVIMFCGGQGSSVFIVIVFCAGQGSSVFIVIVFCAGQGSSMFLETSSDSEGEEKDDCKKANLRIDDWIAFKVDAEVTSLLPIFFTINEPIPKIIS